MRRSKDNRQTIKVRRYGVIVVAELIGTDWRGHGKTRQAAEDALLLTLRRQRLPYSRRSYIFA